MLQIACLGIQILAVSQPQTSMAMAKLAVQQMLRSSRRIVNQESGQRWILTGKVAATTPSLLISAEPLGRPHAMRYMSTNEQTISPSEDEIFKANQNYQGVLKIETIGSRGLRLMALKDFVPDDLVIIGEALYSWGFQNSSTIQTEIKSHTIMDLPARLLNHRCGTANLYARDNDIGAYNFYARSAITKNEELTYDFETTEYEMDGHKCTCGSPKCRGKLRGFKYSEVVMRELWEPRHIAVYLNDMTVGEEKEENIQEN